MNGYAGQVPDTHQRPSDWMDTGACRGQDTNIWYDDITRQQAKRICLTCPPRRDCLDRVLRIEKGKALSDRHGIYAALTPKERVRLDPDAPQLPSDTGTPKRRIHRRQGPRPLTLEERLEGRDHGEYATYKAGCHCEVCVKACNAYHRELRARKAAGVQPKARGREPAPCGTAAAYRRHKKKKEPVCPACAAEHARIETARRHQRDEEKVLAAWHRGLSDLRIAQVTGLPVLAVERARDRLGILPRLHTAEGTGS